MDCQQKYVCFPFLLTSKCPNGDICILEHVFQNDVLPFNKNKHTNKIGINVTLKSSQKDHGRETVQLPLEKLTLGEKKSATGKCDLCGIHPTDPKHTEICLQKHTDEMVAKIGTAASQDKVCGICFDTIMQKPDDKRFAILPECNHCFCLTCIRTWRKSELYNRSIRFACPQCRVVSDYVCPNTYWVENKEEKQRVIEKYKGALAAMDCKYFRVNGRCKFGNKCFYKHCDKDGRHVELRAPRRRSEDGERLSIEELMLYHELMGFEEEDELWNFSDYDGDRDNDCDFEFDSGSDYEDYEEFDFNNLWS